MPELIQQPSRVTAAGEPPKLIDEYVGRVNTGQDGLSIAHMRSPSGWAEPGQRPEFDEFTIVLRGALVVESEGGQLTVQAGQGVHTRPGEWVRYSTPGADGAEYIAVCVPAFAPGTVHRDDWSRPRRRDRHTGPVALSCHQRHGRLTGPVSPCLRKNVGRGAQPPPAALWRQPEQHQPYHGHREDGTYRTGGAPGAR
ncbi:MAG: cupin domain-containing protein [Streptosporangiaceae bacterium]